jgi:hypothetical protein
MAAAYGTASQLDNISLGMTKADVIEKLGRPRFTSTNGQVEYMEYQWVDGVLGFPNLPKEYYVAIRDNHVISYGKKGDFDTARNASSEIDIRQSVDVTSHKPPVPSGTVAVSDELAKLYALKKSGALTDEEYQNEKRKLLDGQ